MYTFMVTPRTSLAWCTESRKMLGGLEGGDWCSFEGMFMPRVRRWRGRCWEDLPISVTRVMENWVWRDVRRSSMFLYVKNLEMRLGVFWRVVGNLLKRFFIYLISGSLRMYLSMKISKVWLASISLFKLLKSKSFHVTWHVVSSNIMKSMDQYQYLIIMVCRKNNIIL